MSTPAVRTGALVPSNPLFSRTVPEHQQALDRCIDKLYATMRTIGLRSPKIGRPDLTWTYCGAFDWVCSFYPGQLWLAYQLTGDPVFCNNAGARHETYRNIMRNQAAQNHDLGFQFSLSCVAEWMMTGNEAARKLALSAATSLLTRFNPAGNYLQAWNARSPELVERSVFVAGRIIVDSLENMALLNWAYDETGRPDFREIAETHSDTLLRYNVRPDGSSYHCYLFDPATGKPLRGQQHQGYADETCWSRGQGWLIHGFAIAYQRTGNPRWLEAVRTLAKKAEEMLGDKEMVPYDYMLPEGEEAYADSSAAAITASGVYILADNCEPEEAERWRAFADRLVAGLLKHSDLTRNPDAHGLLDHGASHVKIGLSRSMLPYGDYYFMEALMRSLGHNSFFW